MYVQSVISLLHSYGPGASSECSAWFLNRVIADDYNRLSVVIFLSILPLLYANLLQTAAIFTGLPPVQSLKICTMGSVQFHTNPCALTLYSPFLPWSVCTDSGIRWILVIYLQEGRPRDWYGKFSGRRLTIEGPHPTYTHTIGLEDHNTQRCGSSVVTWWPHFSVHWRGVSVRDEQSAKLGTNQSPRLGSNTWLNVSTLLSYEEQLIIRLDISHA